MSRPARQPLDRSLGQLVESIRSCRVCLDRPTGKPLPHAPRPVVRVSGSARVLICGQAPGTRVLASGLPFSDPSGVRLRAWMGIDEATFYDEARIAMLPVGFCFPGHDARGGDLPPRRECAPIWRKPVLEHLGQVRLVLLVGGYAQRWHLKLLDAELAGLPLSVVVARWREVLGLSALPRHLPLPHPSWRNTSWIARNPWFEDELVAALRIEVAAALG